MLRKSKNRGNDSNSAGIDKAPTGIVGLDEVTLGGFPRGRPTLVCGGAGCGKTLLAMEFLVRGAEQYNEPGLFVSFEETPNELKENVRSLGFDLNKLEKQKKLLVESIRVDPREIQETGEYDLEGLFIRLGSAIDSIGAKRVVLDTVEILFSGFTNTAIIRAELRRLLQWLKDKRVTLIVTGEKGSGDGLTRFGIEEYISDCVLVLDHRMKNQMSIRRLRILKYRGSSHGTNEYPFLIDETGFNLQPITSIGLSHEASSERISSGIPDLDAMLSGKGFYRGSTILITGTAGTGKTSLAAQFVNAACSRAESCLYFAMEESNSQIQRNMLSIGVDLRHWVNNGLLSFYCERPMLYGLEMHLVTIFKRIKEQKPSIVVLDPITAFMQMGTRAEVKSMLMRMIDFFKMHNITFLATSLTGDGSQEDETTAGVSSLIDSWILLRSQDTGGMRDHGIFILKARGMAHSNGIRQFRFTDKGIVLQ